MIKSMSMSGLAVEIKRVKVKDLLTITRMAYANMNGVDSQFTELVSNPLGHYGGYFFFPFYFGLTGDGYKAVHEGKIVGCAYLYLNNNSGYVFNVNVNRAYRRQGIGRQLMNFLESVTKDQNRHFMALQVENSNLPAKRLYRELGYRTFHPHFLRLDVSSRMPLAVESAVALEPLNRGWGRRFFNRYQTIERREGDSWAAKVLADYQSNETDGSRFWRCVVGGEEAGAAQQQKVNGGLGLSLALKPEFWGHIGESGLVKQLMDESLQDQPYLDLYFNSSGHYRAAVSMFKQLGFKEMVQPRLLMIKEIGGEGHRL
ncbi:MAG: GNAT family N-acetyltransferase [Candidatus Promineifilaceae bacterium]